MASSFYQNDPEDNNAYKKMVVLCVAAASVVMLLFLIVLYMNSKDRRANTEAVEAVEQTETDEEIEVGKSNLTSSDLDFWDMYADEEEEAEPEDEETNSVSANFTDKKTTDEEAEKESMTDIPEDEKLPSDEEMNDGNHISIEDEEGNKVWYEILDSVPKNTYQFSEYLRKDGEKLSYSENGKSSVFGIDVSKYQGEIDWELVRESGVQFAMLRVASRGYGSGQLLLDDNFVKYAEGANKNGIKVGVYVYSQAVSELEAIEEANFAVAAVSNYHITYPIACDIEEVENDTARTDELTADERTKIVKAFCDTVKTYGYKPVIYAERDMLISKLDMEVLKDYDVWLADSNGTIDSTVSEAPNADSSTNRSTSSTNNSSTNRNTGSSMNNGSTNSNSSTARNNTTSSSMINTSNTQAGITTDFPYQFTMWQYSKAGTINGINGSVDLNICFVNYEEK